MLTNSENIAVNLILVNIDNVHNDAQALQYLDSMYAHGMTLSECIDYLETESYTGQ
jgi:hypothetical protein